MGGGRSESCDDQWVVAMCHVGGGGSGRNVKSFVFQESANCSDLAYRICKIPEMHICISDDTSSNRQPRLEWSFVTARLRPQNIIFRDVSCEY